MTAKRVLRTLLKTSVYLVLVISVLLGLVLTAGPMFAIRYAEDWYAGQYPGQSLQIADWDLQLLQGRLALLDIAVHQPDGGSIPQLQRLTLEQIQLSWQYRPLLESRFSGDLSLSGLQLEASDLPPLTLGGLQLEGIRADQWQQQLRQLTLSGLRLGGAAKPLLTLERYQIEHLKADPQAQRFSTGLHGYRGLVAQLEKQADGTLRGLSPVDDTPPASAPPAAEHSREKAATTPVADAPLSDSDAATRVAAGQPADGGVQVQSQARGPVADDADAAQQAASDENERVAEVVATAAKEKTADTAPELIIAGIRQLGQESQLHFHDASVTPAAELSLQIKTLKIGQINSADLTQPVLLELEAALDDYNQLLAEGTLALVEGYPQGRMVVEIRQLNLVAFNGYLAQAMGYQVHKGSLQLEADVRVDQAQLDGSSKLLLRNSEFVPVDEDTIDRLSKQISMPVETALSLLKDDNNNIRLKVPLTGRVDDPDVGLDDLTSQLSTLALKQAAGYYLKQALQPYGTLISLSSYAGDYLLAIRLDDLRYQPLQAEVSEEQGKYLNKVAEMMLEKPALELQVCGFASHSEAQSLADNPQAGLKNWQQLALSRALLVKSWFKQHHPQALERVTTCQPQQGDEAVVSLGF